MFSRSFNVYFAFQLFISSLFLSLFLLFPLSAVNQKLAEPKSNSLPLLFEKNEGQADQEVAFLSRGSGYTLYFSPKEITVALGNRSSLPQANLKLRFLGSREDPAVKGAELKGCKSSYFIGKDPSRWLSAIPNYGKVCFEELYPGINALFYGNERQIEYDLCVAPKGEPSDIRIYVGGASHLTLDSEGNLHIVIDGTKEVLMQKPYIYQTVSQNRNQVEGSFVLLAKNEVGFQVSSYDKSLPLIIDPVLSYSTYLGGNGGDQGRAIAVDNQGNAYITGTTNSLNFPLVNPVQSSYGGGDEDAFVTKINADATEILYSTYLGGANKDQGNRIAVDKEGNAYIVGQTVSPDFPVTAGAFQTTYGGGGFNAFIAKINSTGTSLLYSTYLGGDDKDKGYGIAVDGAKQAYVTGEASSSNFPVTAGAYQTVNLGSKANAFVTKLNAEGSGLIYSTFLGGGVEDIGQSIAINEAGQAYITGWTSSSDFPTTSGAYQSIYGGGDYDVFISKLSLSGGTLLHSTFFGGSGSDQAEGVVLDQEENVYLVGKTASSADFPISAGAYQSVYGGGDSDVFIAKLDSTLSTVAYSTYLGGDGTDDGRGIAVDSAGYAYLTGNTESTNFPTSPNAYQQALAGVNGDAFVSKLSPAGDALIYSTYFGGSIPSNETSNVGRTRGLGIALDSVNNAYITGVTNTTNFPISSLDVIQPAFGGGDDDVYISKFAIGTPIVKKVVPQRGKESGGRRVAIRGANFFDVTNVDFGDVAATRFRVKNENAILAVSPQGASTVDVTVTTPFGTSKAVELGQFTYHPLPPLDLKGDRKGKVNVLRWKKPFDVAPILEYRVYRNRKLKKAIGVVPADEALVFKDGKINPKKSYTYYVVTVNIYNLASRPAKVTVFPSKEENKYEELKKSFDEKLKKGKFSSGGCSC